MKWDRRKVNTACKRTSSKQNMEVLFINLLREYIQLEYQEYESKFKHTFDLERIIDDFIILSFFIGNDFLHKLYCMNTKKGNFDEIITRFKETTAGLDGYITDNGEVNWRRFLALLKNILYMEPKMINTTLGDMQDFIKDLEKGSHHLVLLHDEEDLDEDMEEFENKEKRSKKKRGKKGPEKEVEVKFAEETPLNEDPEEAKFQVEKEFGGHKRKEDLTSVNFRPHEMEFRIHHNKIKQEVEYISGLLNVLEGGDERDIAKEKIKFYRKFFKIQDISNLEQICLQYLKGIQFVMYYYFRGCPSWTWFYPYFMSPFLSDVITILDRELQTTPDLDFKVQVDKPFKPFNQLVYILPKASFFLLPPVYAETIFAEENNVLHFYPEEYEFEPFDGIKDYMWIADIKVIDEKELDVALAKVDESKLSEADKHRNSLGRDIIYKYKKGEKLREVKSTLKGLPDI